MNKKPLYLLLADDDTDDCLFFKEALEDLKINALLTTVKDGVELMKLLSDKKLVLPHVLYLDLNMPRKNGFECLAEIKQNVSLQQLPIIIFSTSLDADVVNLTHQHGADLYVRKPSDFVRLKETISKSLDLILNFPSEKIPKEMFVVNTV
ncbi:response regulator [Aquiflexum sp. TKW24L]|uniref:response regulator n=1 Tax=Aquiflexum sp. TKW24L TaxID=2942212 RepID=UPI0020BF26F1|nr:response regulator [Aquiflexum sp. TKW24L]MCL6261038.1 response regulator [Aquiflexum sp. TKW24L]